MVHLYGTHNFFFATYLKTLTSLKVLFIFFFTQHFLASKKLLENLICIGTQVFKVFKLVFLAMLNYLPQICITICFIGKKTEKEKDLEAEKKREKQKNRVYHKWRQIILKFFIPSPSTYRHNFYFEVFM
jgi:hypothetical protein